MFSSQCFLFFQNFPNILNRWGEHRKREELKKEKKERERADVKKNKPKKYPRNTSTHRHNRHYIHGCQECIPLRMAHARKKNEHEQRVKNKNSRWRRRTWVMAAEDGTQGCFGCQTPALRRCPAPLKSKKGSSKRVPWKQNLRACMRKQRRLNKAGKKM